MPSQYAPTEPYHGLTVIDEPTGGVTRQTGPTQPTRATRAYLDTHKEDMLEQIKTKSVETITKELITLGIPAARRSVREWFEPFPAYRDSVVSKRIATGKWRHYRQRLQESPEHDTPRIHALHRGLNDLTATDMEALRQKAMVVLGQKRTLTT